jgi:hypothetical protein
MKNCYVTDLITLGAGKTQTAKSQDPPLSRKKPLCLIREAKKLRDRNELCLMGKTRSDQLRRNLACEKALWKMRVLYNPAQIYENMNIRK